MSLSMVKSHSDLKEINAIISGLELFKDKGLSMSDVLVIDMSELKKENNFSKKLENSLTKKSEIKTVSTRKNTIK